MQIQVQAAQEGLPNVVYARTYEADEQVNVRDLSSRLIRQVPAKELSMYRHTLFVDGWSYRIVGITKLDPARSGKDGKSTRIT